jgi:Domain of unknown function (DUF4136)
MRRLALVLFVLLAGTAGAACRGTHPAPVYAWDQAADFSGMKTYAWHEPPGFQVPHGDSIIDGQFIDRTVRQAVDGSLGKKGFRKVDAANASMLVSYGTGDTRVTDQVKNWNRAVLTGYENTMYEKSRQVIIDVYDPAKTLVWQGSITRLEGENPDEAGREIRHEVDVLLSHFPPAPGSTPTK